MTYHYKGKDIGNRMEAVKFIMALPFNELYNFVYTYLDRFDEEQLKDLIWYSMDCRSWTMVELVEDALLMMEGEWEDSYAMSCLDKGETTELGYLEYEDWKEEGMTGCGSDE